MEAVEEWHQATSDPGGRDFTELARAVEDLLDQEVSFAEQNAKRLKLVRETFRRPGFEVTVSIVDALISPLDRPMNTCLQRSSILSALRFPQPGSSPDGQHEQLMQKARDMFVQWSSGQMGLSVVSDFMSRMKSPDLASLCQSVLESNPGLPKTCFQLLIFGMSDTWRRMCFATSSFPHKMFKLLDCNAAGFVAKWGEFRQTLLACSECVDASFSAPLLKSVDFEGLTAEDTASTVEDLQRLLNDLATFCPLATDLVENQHGQQQSALTKFRGKCRTPKIAAELSLLHSVKMEHAKLKSIVDEAALPTHMRCAQMLRNLGRKKGKKLEVKSRMRRVKQAATRKLRRINGWNIFQREQLRRRTEPVPNSEFKTVVGELGQRWRNTSAEDKRAYALRANFEHECRLELESRPLSHGKSRQETLLPNQRPGETAELERCAGG